MTLRSAIIGCGKPWGATGATGSGISHGHARGYRACALTDLVAVADISQENADAFVAEHGPATTYLEYHELLAVEKPDMVSICTWPHLHEEMVLACAKAGVRGIHCEKPMAPTLGASRRMKAAADEAGVLLTFNHQRRFEPPYTVAKEWLDSGKIGELKRLEMPTVNLFDWGTHWFDMAFHFNNQVPAKWLMAQVDPENGSTVFGVTMENRAIVRAQYETGVELLMPTGDANYEFNIRLVGSAGSIEIGWNYATLVNEEGIGKIDTGEAQKALVGFELPITNLAECVVNGGEPVLSARKALMATEMIFAAYESGRRGGRIDFPFDQPDAGIYAG